MAIGNHGRSVTDLLRQAEVFARLSDPELRKIRKLLKERHLSQNQIVFRQGDLADALYIVLAGRMRISVTNPTGGEKVLNFAGVGDVVGEMGLLSGDPRSATATTTTDTTLLQLRKADFDSLLSNDLDFMRELARVIALRREATQQRAFDETDGSAGRREGLVSVVFSPRGGAGTTTIATNLAVALAHRAPDRVVLVDLKVLFGHVPLLLNLVPRTSLAAISAVSLGQMDRESFEFYLTTHADTSLRVLPAVLRPEDGELISAEQARAVLELLRRHFAYVIVDMGRSFSEVNLAAIEVSDNILIVCTPDRVGIRAVTESQRIFRELLKLPGDPLQYVLNHPAPYTLMAPEELEQALQARFVGTIPFGGDAPARAALEGRPIVTRWPSSVVSKAILSMAMRVEQQAREAFALAAR
jgi:CRP-like cAMP-binding protein